MNRPELEQAKNSRLEGRRQVNLSDTLSMTEYGSIEAVLCQ